MIRTIGVLAAVSVCAAAVTNHQASPHRLAPHPLVVHEWGTVTTRHEADGTADGRLNQLAAYDPLPPFVHRFEPVDTAAKRIPLIKTIDGPGRADITMRLETPVIYFHPGPDDTIPPFDVSVDFHGGVLNEFYPDGAATAHGWKGQLLSDTVVGSLAWRGVTLREHLALPATTSHVWLAPRAVSSRPVSVRGESEQYLFYRGMAHLDAPLRTQLTRDELIVRGPASAPWLAAPSAVLGHLWLVDARPGGIVAFRETDSLSLSRGDAVLARFADFKESEYSANALAALRASMRRALAGRGLDDDEAAAMLETWKRSYFTEPGLRLFYIAPAEWVNYYLPMRISIPHTLTRVIVGRIDLTPPAAP